MLAAILKVSTRCILFSMDTVTLPLAWTCFAMLELVKVF